MTKFKVGDRVRAIKDTPYSLYKIGHEGEVSSVWNAAGVVGVMFHGYVANVKTENLELVEKMKDFNVPWYETEEGKQWLSEQTDLEEYFKKAQKPSQTFEIGQKFLVKSFGNEFECLLSQVDYSMVCLIAVPQCNRMHSPIKVLDVKKIVWEELKEMVSDPEAEITLIS